MDPNELKYNAQADTSQQGGMKSHIVDFIQTLVVFLAIGTAIYMFVAKPHKVSGLSMSPNFKNNDFIITEQVTYKFGQPQRGDIVVFIDPLDESKDFIKRIIAKPGERVKLENGHYYVNGKLLEEPYLDASLTTPGGAFLQEGQEVTVPSKTFFASGDNRHNSTDSREIGPIPDDKLKGRVVLRYWPLNMFGVLPAAYKFKE